jgi:hypothetical protein
MSLALKLKIKIAVGGLRTNHKFKGWGETVATQYHLLTAVSFTGNVNNRSDSSNQPRPNSVIALVRPILSRSDSEISAASNQAHACMWSSKG